MEDEKHKVLNALKAGKYSVDYDPVNSIYEYTRYDGTSFYVMEDLDGARSCVDLGSITFIVKAGRSKLHFYYDMNGNGWSGDELCEDEDVVSALEDLNEFINAQDYDGDQQREVYIKAYGLPRNTEIYWCEDDDRPKDIESLGNDEVEVPLQYFIAMGHGTFSEYMDMECTISDEDLYHIYKLMKKNGFFEDIGEEGDIEFPGLKIQKEYPELYQNILEQVEQEAGDSGYENEDDNLKFVLLISKELLDENL